jgi:NitT/TauT family transport system substrate-binding protein
MLTRTPAAFAAAVPVGAPASAQDLPKIAFALDRTLAGPSAAHFAATDNGHCAAEGLEVAGTAGDGSVATIPGIATGAFPAGFGDINPSIGFLHQHPGAPVTAVMMICAGPAVAVTGRRSLGVAAPVDLEGKALGAPLPDGARAPFPAFARAKGLDVARIKGKPVGVPTRASRLAGGRPPPHAGPPADRWRPDDGGRPGPLPTGQGRGSAGAAPPRRLLATGRPAESGCVSNREAMENIV